MQKKSEKGRVATISITEITVNRKAHRPGLSPTVAVEQIKLNQLISGFEFNPAVTPTVDLSLAELDCCNMSNHIKHAVANIISPVPSASPSGLCGVEWTTSLGKWTYTR